MSDVVMEAPVHQQGAKTLFTILAGTTVPKRAAIVRDHCKVGSRVKIRRSKGAEDEHSRMHVWLECRAPVRFMKTWKKIGYVPHEAAAEIQPTDHASAGVVAYGVVKAFYAPHDRDEAVVTVEIGPLAS